MKYDPDLHHRRSIRLLEFDYTLAGLYFVTVCTWRSECLFGVIIDGRMHLSGAGEIVKQCWEEIPRHFPNAGLDASIVMPNHVHGIIVLTDRDPRALDVGARHAVPSRSGFGKPVPGSLATIIRSFKSAASRKIRATVHHTPDVWQRNYYEHIIRDDDELNGIREYIFRNPLNRPE